MTAAADFQHPIGPHTVQEWRTAEHPANGGRLELIWGYFHVSPPPGGPHQYATGAIYRALWDAVRSASREDLYPVLGVGVEISSALRTALIPDVAILNARPIGVSFPAQALELAVEVWSPGNTRSERETKVAAYAAAQVPYLWIVDHPDGPDGPLQFRAHQLAGGVYKEVAYGCAGAVVTAAASPIPVTLDLAELQP